MTNIEAHNFFKFYLSNFSFHRMLIPHDAVVCPDGSLPATVTFRNCKEECWLVEMNYHDDRLCFEKGWRNFIDENFIEDKDVLVFSYVGYCVFDVNVLGPDTECEKSYPPLRSEELETSRADKGKRVEENDEGNDQDDQIELEKETGKEVQHTSNKTGRQKQRNKRSFISVEVDDKEFDPEIYVQPLNPYFVAHTYGGRENELHIPRKLIRDFELKFEDNEEITFLDPYNRKKIGKVVKWKDGRTCIYGWAGFLRRNKVKLERDICICEFMLGEEKEGEEAQKSKIIKVHIIPRNRNQAP